MEGKRQRTRPREHDEVTEAGEESFPASDPPAFNQRGRSKKRRETQAAPAEQQARAPDERDVRAAQARAEPEIRFAQPRDEPTGRPAQSSAIEQGMARQNVRIHPERAAPEAQAGGESRGVNRAAVIAAAILIAAIVLWMAFT